MTDTSTGPISIPPPATRSVSAPPPPPPTPILRRNEAPAPKRSASTFASGAALLIFGAILSIVPFAEPEAEALWAVSGLLALIGVLQVTFAIYRALDSADHVAYETWLNRK